jgi:putative ABC transport system permease protein
MNKLFDGWTWRMAWRDSRTHRGRLAFFMSSMVLGVAALVAISSFSDSLEQTLHDEARSLLGADFSLEKDHEAFSDSARAVIDSIGGEQTNEIAFTSMALFPESGGTRLSRIRVLDGPFPYYGWFTTTPEAAADSFRQGPYAVVDHNLMTQYEVEVGDSVRIGQRSYAIAGRLEGTSTENAAISSFAPRIFIPRKNLDRSLLATGSQAEYRVYFKFDEPRDIDRLSDEIREKTGDEDVDIDTVEETQDRWTDALNNLNGFLKLVAFIALLLGGIGVGSAVHVYVKQKLRTVAVLRCVGARTSQTFVIYLIQAGTMGLAASVVGVLLGTGLQVFLPDLLQSYLPVDVTFSVSWAAIVQGLLLGVGTALLFALIPLLSIRRVSPLQALRVAYEPSSSGIDPWRWAVGACIAAAVTAFAVIQTGEWDMGFAFAGGVAAVFLLLAGVARGII